MSELMLWLHIEQMPLNVKRLHCVYQSLKKKYTYYPQPDTSLYSGDVHG